MDLNTIEAIIAPGARGDLAAFGPGDAWLAGGSALFADASPLHRRLFDLQAFGWPALTWLPDGALEIAATCTMAELARLRATPEAPALHLALACCQALRGSFKVWNVATVGGNICAALPAGPMTSLAAGLGGLCTIWTPDGGERRMLASELVTGDERTALAPGELLRAITLPGEALRSRAAMRQESLTPIGRSAALPIGRQQRAADGGAFHLTLTAAVDHPVVFAFPDGLPTAAELAAAIEERLAPEDYFDDIHGTPEWRRHLTGVLSEQIRAELAGEAGA